MKKRLIKRLTDNSKLYTIRFARPWKYAKLPRKEEMSEETFCQLRWGFLHFYPSELRELVKQLQEVLVLEDEL